MSLSIKNINTSKTSYYKDNSFSSINTLITLPQMSPNTTVITFPDKSSNTTIIMDNNKNLQDEFDKSYLTVLSDLDVSDIQYKENLNGLLNKNKENIKNKKLHMWKAKNDIIFQKSALNSCYKDYEKQENKYFEQQIKLDKIHSELINLLNTIENKHIRHINKNKEYQKENFWVNNVYKIILQMLGMESASIKRYKLLLKNNKVFKELLLNTNCNHIDSNILHKINIFFEKEQIENEYNKTSFNKSCKLLLNCCQLNMVQYNNKNILYDNITLLKSYMNEYNKNYAEINNKEKMIIELKESIRILEIKSTKIDNQFILENLNSFKSKNNNIDTMKESELSKSESDEIKLNGLQQLEKIQPGIKLNKLKLQDSDAIMELKSTWTQSLQDSEGLDSDRSLYRIKMRKYNNKFVSKCCSFDNFKLCKN